MDEIIKILEEIKEYQIQNIQLAKTTDIYKLAEKAMNKALSIAAVSGMLPDQTSRHIDLAYLIGVFNVVGIDGLQKELTRLKEIGKNPHDIFAEGNYR